MGFVNMGWIPPDRVVLRTQELARSLWGAPPRWLLGGGGRVATPLVKKVISRRLWLRQHELDAQALVLREPNTCGRQSNSAFLQTVGDGRRHRPPVAVWQRWVPCFRHRVFLRRMLVGIIPHLRVNAMKWGSLPSGWDASRRQQWLQCPCGQGPQDAHHFWFECGFSQSTRHNVLSRALQVLQVRHCDVSFWESMPSLQRHLHLLGTSTMFDEGTEKILRQETAKIWVSDAESICERLRTLNAASLRFGWIVAP